MFQLILLYIIKNIRGEYFHGGKIIKTVIYKYRNDDFIAEIYGGILSYIPITIKKTYALPLQTFNYQTNLICLQVGVDGKQSDKLTSVQRNSIEDIKLDHSVHLPFSLHINTKISGPKATPDRLIHILKLLDKTELQEAMTTVLRKSYFRQI